MREFKYNVIDLISYVRDRPCLWDKTIENYKDRMERRSAWEEIFNNLEETYEEMAPEEKRITGDSIIRKWSNMRDSFMSSLQSKPGRESRKKNMYAGYLKFLTKTAIINEDGFDSDDDFSESASASYLVLSPCGTTPKSFGEFPLMVSVSSKVSQDSPLQNNKRRDPDDKTQNKPLLEELKINFRNDINSRQDEKETMLLSFLPYIKDMNETEMIDFHIEILTSIKKIIGKRAQNNETSASSGSSSSYKTNTSQQAVTPGLRTLFEAVTAALESKGEMILHKWTNIRDTFLKSLKTRMGRPKKKYLLYDHLQFLTKVLPEGERPSEINNTNPAFMKQEELDSGFSITSVIEPESSTSFAIANETNFGSKKSAKGNDFDDAKSTDYASEVSYSRKSGRVKKKNRLIFVDDSDSVSSKKKSKKSSTQDDVSVNDQLSAIDFVEVDNNDPRIMNEDEAFFASLLPTVVKYNEDERLEFRIEVLGVMKKLKEKRTWMTE